MYSFLCCSFLLEGVARFTAAGYHCKVEMVLSCLYAMFVILWCISPIGYQNYLLQFVKVSRMLLVLALACQFVAGKERVKDYGALSFFIFSCHDILLPFVKRAVTFCYETLQIPGNTSAYFCVVIMDFALCVLYINLSIF